jgi:hypothetical protein
MLGLFLSLDYLLIVLLPKLVTKPYDMGNPFPLEGTMGFQTRKPHFSHSVIIRSPGLMPMLYRTLEIQQALQIDSRELDNFIREGLPNHKDPSGEIWINGKEFSDWVNKIRERNPILTLGRNEALCFKCGKAVAMKDSSITDKVGGHLRKGRCGTCKSIVYKGV